MNKIWILTVIVICLITNESSALSIKTSDGVVLHVTVKGKGIPCLYIHGGPGSGSYWVEKFAGPVLEKYFQMIYLDQRGCCRSTSPVDNNYSLERIILDFEEVRKALKIDKWIIMGHSFAGLMQVPYAINHPEAIKGIIMINCTLNLQKSFETGFCPNACKLLNITDNQPCSNDSIVFIDRFGQLIQLLNNKNLMWKMGYKTYSNFEEMNKTFSEVPNWNWGSEEHIIYNQDYWEDFTKCINKITVPVLFFYGKNDLIIGTEFYKEINFPNMVLWGSDVGHMPFMENKNDLEKAIKTYLKKFKFIP